MTYIIGTDHAGVNLKSFVKDYLSAQGHSVIDLAPDSNERVDYPDYAQKVCEKMLEITESRGILICGSGIGMSIAANRFKHIRAALCTDSYMAKMARAHNDANVLCIGERVIGIGEVEDILQAFCNTSFEGQRHQLRLDKINQL